MISASQCRPARRKRDRRCFRNPRPTTCRRARRRHHPFFRSPRDRFVALAARQAVPVSYFSREFAVAGGLISYGANLREIYRLLGTYAGKILNGAKPADLPVEQPTRYELVVNLKTAPINNKTPKAA